MMLTSPYYSHPTNQHYATYAPPRSSPLSERSADAPPRLFDFSMAQQPTGNQTPTPQRTFKSNPLIQTRDATTKRRRDMFFKRVQNSRDDKKWESRGEQIQQLDFVSERKRWENKKAREAPTENEEIDEELMRSTMVSTSHKNVPQPGSDMTEADYLLAQEEYELQQLVASMEQEHSSTLQHYGSDDEDYDEIFMECLTSADQYGQLQRQDANHGSGCAQDTDMDMDVDMEMTDG